MACPISTTAPTRARASRSFIQDPSDEVERLNRGFSVLHCLAVGREDDHSVEGLPAESGFRGAFVMGATGAAVTLLLSFGPPRQG